MDRLGHALARQVRGQSQIALIFLDLDNFKLINDSLGHATGDDLLIKVARRLERVLRPEDTAARFGGDEFIVLCELEDSEQDGVDVAERLLAAVALPISLPSHPNMVVTASAGIAIASGPGFAPEALVRCLQPGPGLIGPPEFIPIAEESPLIVPLGEWVLNEACHQGARWQEQYPDRPPLRLCVNVSPKQ